jgi:hypothetical protein
MYRYHYTFAQKAMFMSLWLFGSVFVAINFFSNPLLSMSSSTPILSMTVTFVQVTLLLLLWWCFVKASYSMGGMLRWLGAGIIILPYVAQVGLLSYITL